jgi:hypothetical protein
MSTVGAAHGNYFTPDGSQNTSYKPFLTTGRRAMISQVGPSSLSIMQKKLRIFSDILG